MINIEDRHLEVVKKILNKYDYSFFLFGSRITTKAKKFSDIDLLYFEHIPNNIILQLEEEFEESDLPYKVDLVNYHKCDFDFQQIIANQYICLQSSTTLHLIEQNHLGHFISLPKALGFEVYQKGTAYIINSSLATSMFNIVYGATNIAIEQIIQQFQGQPFAWWIPASLKTPELTQRLTQAGLALETTEHAMICNLNTIQSTQHKQSKLKIKQVQNNRDLQDFIKIIEAYDQLARKFYTQLNNSNFNSYCEQLFIGYANEQPVTIATLFLAQNSAAIFNLITINSQRRKGYGTDMMHHLLQVAKSQGVNYLTLSSSSDAGYNIYQTLGFSKIAEFECLEYKP